MIDQKEKIGYTRVIFYFLAIFLYSSLLINEISFSGCKIEAGGYLSLETICMSSAPNWVVFMANIPNKIILFPQLLGSNYYGTAIILFQFFLLGLITFGLYIFIVFLILDILRIKRHKIEIDKKVLIILFLDMIFLIFVIVAFFSWFIPEIPSIIDSLVGPSL